MGRAADLARLAASPLADRKVLLVAFLNARLPRGKRAVLVGGSLVELYTGGAYVSADIDLIGDRSAVAAVLGDMGFARDGRHFLHDGLGLVVEVPGETLRPTETVVDLEFEGHRLPAVSVEDAIVDRLLAAKFWASRTDREQAILLLGAHRGALDERALREKAARNDVADALADAGAFLSGEPAGSEEGQRRRARDEG